MLCNYNWESLQTQPPEVAHTHVHSHIVWLELKKCCTVRARGLWCKRYELSDVLYKPVERSLGGCCSTFTEIAENKTAMRYREDQCISRGCHSFFCHCFFSIYINHWCLLPQMELETPCWAWRDWSCRIASSSLYNKSGLPFNSNIYSMPAGALDNKDILKSDI